MLAQGDDVDEFGEDSAFSDLCGCSTESDSDAAETGMEDSKTELHEGYYVAKTSYVLDFVGQINDTSRCATKDCQGKLIL